MAVSAVLGIEMAAAAETINTFVAEFALNALAAIRTFQAIDEHVAVIDLFGIQAIGEVAGFIIQTIIDVLAVFRSSVLVKSKMGHVQSHLLILLKKRA